MNYSKLMAANKKIETVVVGTYKKIEHTTVNGFNRIADKFVTSFLMKPGESIEQTKKRLEEEQLSRMKK